MEIREARREDVVSLLELYTQLHDHALHNTMPALGTALEELWDSILNDKNHHVILGIVDGTVVCSCVIVVILNLTRGQRPYALIENVITDERHRNKGYASAILNFAWDIAKQENCYKIMLMTGSKSESTLRFYEKAGYNQQDKTAFIQWLE